MSETVWRRCGECGEDWPADSFRGGGNAYRWRGKKVCGACFEELYPKVFGPCEDCGRRMQGRGRRGVERTAPLRHRVCPPPKIAVPRVSLHGLPCVVCGTMKYHAHNDIPKRGWSICLACVPRVPPEYEHELNGSEIKIFRESREQRDNRKAA